MITSRGKSKENGKGKNVVAGSDIPFHDPLTEVLPSAVDSYADALRFRGMRPLVEGRNHYLPLTLSDDVVACDITWGRVDHKRAGVRAGALEFPSTVFAVHPYPIRFVGGNSGGGGKKR